MHGTYIIEVGYKKGLTDPVGHGLVDDIRHLGTPGVQQVTTSQLYRLIGDLSVDDRNRIAQDLLCDPVVQEFRDGIGAQAAPSAPRSKAGAKQAIIDVWFKAGVT